MSDLELVRRIERLEKRVGALASLISKTSDTSSVIRCPDCSWTHGTGWALCKRHLPKEQKPEPEQSGDAASAVIEGCLVDIRVCPECNGKWPHLSERSEMTCWPCQRKKFALKRLDYETEMEDMLQAAWGVIANASNGNWDDETKTWQEAAVRWRDNYHALLKKRK